VSDPTPHLTSEEVSGYVSRVVRGEARDRIEEHLDRCAECRDELLEVTSLMRVASRGRRVRWAGGIGAAAAAAAAVLVFGPGIGSVDSGREPQLRNGAGLDEGVRKFETVAPSDGDAVSALGGSVFLWRQVAPDAFYSLTVTDERGDLVWRGSTADTMLQLPRDLEAEAGTRYYWFVEALLTDGTTATTDANRLWAEP
jgi:hypothetical protein